jgi:hypothetical protein
MRLHIQAKPQGKRPRPVDARSKWAGAMFLRRKAHELDPHHEDPAWEQEQPRTPAGRDTHAEMMLFYKSMQINPLEPEPDPIPEPVVEEPRPPDPAPPIPAEPITISEPLQVEERFAPRPEPETLNLEREYQILVRQKKPRKPRAKTAAKK